MTVTVADKIRFELDGIIGTFTNSNIFVRSVRSSGVSTAFSLFSTAKLVNGFDVVYVAKDKAEKAKFKDMLTSITTEIKFDTKRGSDVFAIDFGNSQKSRIFVASAKDINDLIEDLQELKTNALDVIEIDYFIADRVDDWDLGSILSMVEYKDIKIKRFVVNGNYVDIEGESSYKIILEDAKNDRNGWTLLEIFQPASNTFDAPSKKVREKIKFLTLSFKTITESLLSLAKVIGGASAIIVAIFEIIKQLKGG